MTIDKVIEFIDKNIETCRRIDIDMLTAYSGYSRRHLQRLFFIQTGISIGEYIRRRRLNRTALLLRFSLRSFKDIALSLGFNCQQAFNRDFKKATGLSPGQYRNNPEWALFPLTGRIQKEFDFSEPEEVFLPGGELVGEEVIFFGKIDYKQESNSFLRYLERIFSIRELSDQNELWGVATVTPVSDSNYHYQVSCGLGIPDGRIGKVFHFSSGKYLKSTFETSLDTHKEKVNYLYLNILPGSNVVRRSGSEIFVFRHIGELVMCTIYIPVA